jgi:hypothetical protein
MPRGQGHIAGRSFHASIAGVTSAAASPCYGFARGGVAAEGACCANGSPRWGLMRQQAPCRRATQRGTAERVAGSA